MSLRTTLLASAVALAAALPLSAAEPAKYRSAQEILDAPANDACQKDDTLRAYQTTRNRTGIRNIALDDFHTLRFEVTKPVSAKDQVIENANAIPLP